MFVFVSSPIFKARPNIGERYFPDFSFTADLLLFTRAYFRSFGLLALGGRRLRIFHYFSILPRASYASYQHK